MQLESIKLENFRQFQNEYIQFAKGDDGKNVTIIIGENGTGKTTFAQSFFWCLYGETDFSDKVLLNKSVAQNMLPDDKEDVRVTLVLRHGDVEYELIRKQTYSKDYRNNIKSDYSTLDIKRKRADGNTEFVKKTQCESEVQSILPKELSRYFFFDGERIENMSKAISSGKKSDDFANAVQGLLGLNGYLSAINHLNPRSSYSVIGSYEKSFNAKSNSKIDEYTQKIIRYKSRLNEIDARLEELESDIASATSTKEELMSEIKQYSEGAKMQNEREKILARIEDANRSKAEACKAACKIFNSSLDSFFSISLIKRALDVLSERDFAGKDIPFMHQKTIEYILNQKVCICGTHLDEGSIAYNKVKELMDFLPPKSLSTTISDFKKHAQRSVGSNGDGDLKENISGQLAIISKLNDDIDDMNDELQKIDAILDGKDAGAKVNEINRKIKECDDTIRRSHAERDKLNRDRGGFEKDLERADTERSSLALVDEQNRKIQVYLTYARRIYEDISNHYKASEKEIREKVKDTINDIFRQIFNGDLELEVDEKYHITVHVLNHDGNLETSSAQSIAVIFAFITGIMKLAREYRNATDADDKLLSSEPYPLVMDAPLSAFDKKRIRTVCETLPQIAEQVVIFIKDTDGDLAEEYMGAKIGCKHSFRQIDAFHTELI